MSKTKKVSKKEIIKAIKQKFEFQKWVKFRDGKVIEVEKLVVSGELFERVVKISISHDK